MLSQMGQPPVGQWSVGEDWLKQHWEMTCSTFKLQMGEILKEPSDHMPFHCNLHIALYERASRKTRPSSNRP